MTQEELAAAQGIAYQQVYKYEKAVNRISASRLYELSKVLNVSVAFFFEGFEAKPKAQKPKRRKAN